MPRRIRSGLHLGRWLWHSQMTTRSLYDVATAQKDVSSPQHQVRAWALRHRGSRLSLCSPPISTQQPLERLLAIPAQVWSSTALSVDTSDSASICVVRSAPTRARRPVLAKNEAPAESVGEVAQASISQGRRSPLGCPDRGSRVSTPHLLNSLTFARTVAMYLCSAALDRCRAPSASTLCGGRPASCHTTYECDRPWHVELCSCATSLGTSEAARPTEVSRISGRLSAFLPAAHCPMPTVTQPQPMRTMGTYKSLLGPVRTLSWLAVGMTPPGYRHRFYWRITPCGVQRYTVQLIEYNPPSNFASMGGER